MYIALKLNEEVIEQAITDALDSAVLENSQPVPAEAYIYAPRLAFIMPPIAVFALVFVLSGIATCLLDASKRTTPVAMGQPVYSAPTVQTWSDGLCSCCNNYGVCCTTCCCPCIPVAQLYERVMGVRYSCLAMVAFFVASWLLTTSASSTCEPTVTCGYEGEQWRCTTVPRADAPALCGWISGLSSLGFLVLLVALMLVRERVRTHHQIGPSCCGPLDDCCCACWCMPLVTCQILRHVIFVERTPYRLFSSVGKSQPPMTMVV